MRVFFLETNLRKKKWIIGFSYNPHVSSISHHMDSMGKAIDFLSTNFKKFLLVGHFNAEESNTSVKDFCDIYELMYLIKEPTYYKNPNNSKSADLNYAESFADPVLKAIEQCKNHPSIRIINDGYKTNSVITFNQVSLEEIQKELKNVNPSKASQSSDIPTKIIRQNLDLFAQILHQEMNQSLDLNKFPSTMKLGNITPSFQKTDQIKKIAGQLVFYLICPKCLKNVYINSYPTFLKFLFLK